MDYLFFATGFFFLASGANIIVLGRTKNIGLTEIPLVFFGILTGLYFWAQLVGVLIPGATGWSQFRAFLLISSSVSLFECGRLMCPRASGAKASLLIYLIPLLIVGGLSLLPSPPEATSAAGISFGIPGGLLLACGFLSKAKNFQGSLRINLRLSAIAIILYAFCLVFLKGDPAVDPAVGFLDTRFKVLGILVALAAGLYSTALWSTYHVSRVNNSLPRTPGNTRIPGSVRVWVVALAILALGWVFTYWIGEYESSQRKSALLLETDLMREALNPSFLMLLEGESSDEDIWVYGNIREQLMRFRSLLSPGRFVYLIARNEEGKAIVLADSEQKISETHFHPGELYPEANNDPNWDLVFSGKKWVGGPDRNSFGNWISAMVPIPLATRTSPIILRVDVDAEEWLSQISRSRLTGITATLSLLLVLIGGYAVVRVHLESREDISAARRRLEIALDSASMATWEWHTSTSLLNVDNRWWQLTGIPPEYQTHSIEGFFERVDATVRDRLKEALGAHLKGQTPHIDEEFYFSADAGKSNEWFQLKGQISLRAADGAPLAISGTLQSIGERVLMQQELRNLLMELGSEKNRLDVLIQNFSGGIVVEDAEHVVYLTNQRLCDLVSIPMENVTGSSSENVLRCIASLSKDPRTCLSAFQRSRNSSAEQHGEIIELADGRYFMLDFVPIQGDPEALGFLWQFRDITSERRSLKILESVAMVNSCLIGTRLEGSGWKEPLELLGEATDTDRVYVFRHFLDPVTNRTLMSQVAEWNSGQEEPQLLNPRLQNLDAEKEGFGSWNELLPQGLEVNSLVANLPAPQREFLEAQNIAAILIMPIFLGKEYWGFIGFDECRTERIWHRGELAILRSAAAAIGLRLSRQRGEDELRQAGEDARRAAHEAEQANRAKSTFLATMSHEIRTPLNAVIGMTSLLQETSLNPLQKEYATTVYNASNTLLELINDILDYSKIESGKFELHPEPVRLPDIVCEIMEFVAPQANNKDLNLQYYIPPCLNTPVTGERIRLKQVLLNLISNAVKFTTEGSVELMISATRASDQTWKVEFLIKDTGIGIPEEVLDKLSQPFFQADSSITRRYGGTGLGLAISTKLIKLMGGTFSVKSQEGVGSEFSFSLDFRELPDSSEMDETANALFGVPALILSEDEIQKKLLQDHLEAWGMRPIPVANIQDVRMALSGIEPKIALITTGEGIHRFPEITHSVTAASGSGAIKFFLISDTPNNPSLVKWEQQTILIQSPIHLEKLRMSIIQSLQEESPGHILDVEPAPHSTEEPAETGLLMNFKVLVAEDNPNNQNVLRLMLRKYGCVPTIVENGKLAVEKAAESFYDLIILDLQMPVLDGLSAAGQILNSYAGKTRRPILLALTANAFQEDRDACLAAGFDRYLSKPVSSSHLREVLSELALLSQ